jgi:hypothetical protein
MRRGPKGRRGAVQQWASVDAPHRIAARFIDGQYRDPRMREYLDRLAAKDDRGDAVRPCEAMTIRSQPFDPPVSMIA